MILASGMLRLMPAASAPSAITQCADGSTPASSSSVESLTRPGTGATAVGHEDAFPRPRLSARYRFSQGTFAGRRGNARDAPIKADRRRAEPRVRRMVVIRAGASLIVPVNNLWVGPVDRGMICVEVRSRRGPQMSAMPDSTLPNSEQLIADLRRQLAVREAELAECKAERDEALARQAAIAEVLQVINSSPGDLAPVFQMMLEKAVHLCEATHGTLRTFDGEAFHLVASVHREVLTLPDAGRGPSSLFRRFIDGEQIIHLADVLDSPEYQFNPGVRAGMDAAQARSWLGVSLRKEARLLGVISVLRQEFLPVL